MRNKCIKARIRARVGGKARGSQALTPGEMVSREVRWVLQMAKHLGRAIHQMCRDGSLASGNVRAHVSIRMVQG